TISATTNQRIVGCTGGGDSPNLSISTTFTWDGPNDGTAFLLDRVRDSVFENFAILPGKGAIGTAIRIDHLGETSGAAMSSHNTFHRITIGRSTTGVRIGNLSTGNNEMHIFDDVTMAQPGAYGYYIHDGQSKYMQILGGSIGFKQHGIWTDRGSLV